MSKRNIEIFTAGCPVCDRSVQAILAAACEHCAITVHDLSSGDPELVRLAVGYGVRRLPAVAIDGELASCCGVGEPELAALRAGGLGAGASGG